MDMSLSRPWLCHYGDIPKSLSYPGCSMYELVRLAAEKYPDTRAWEFEGNHTTYRRFLSRIDAAARALYALGLRSGDRVMLALPNCPQVAELFYAADRIGAVANMVHPLSSVGEFRRYAALSGSRFAVTLESFAPSLCAACPEIPDRYIVHIMTIDKNSTIGNIVGSEDQIHQSCFAGAGFAYQPHILTCMDPE